jgi:cholest-4-en-3-one 26-monooxygenase
MADTEISGQKIKQGDKVLLWYPSSNREEELFECPHKLDVERKPEHQAFGAGGRHFCLGTALARLELKILFEELFARYPNIELIEQPERVRSLFLNQPRELRVRLNG